MIGNRLYQWVFFGSIAGTLLACFFFILEKVWSIRLYTFLVNIDFLPLPREIIFSAPLQFVLHIVISVILIAFVDRMYQKGYKRPYIVAIMINSIMALTFFPLYNFAVTKPFFPPLLLPFILWFIGHLLYACLIAYYVLKINKKRSAD
ncbi:hypothetical protein KUV80_06230 [Fictibacillus nanhaiensis]|uniref:hypothetical protein n=1 Tax=Fictibacillus nanhaiensis TaxID=742169 RepID=UPI001C968291|nr:hypothetical protein [Fictibacillus nanhaiensis]MBY6036240.1 hypothetical protein [Fictibacillus nanhaiensis]